MRQPRPETRNLGFRLGSAKNVQQLLHVNTHKPTSVYIAYKYRGNPVIIFYMICFLRIIVVFPLSVYLFRIYYLCFDRFCYFFFLLEGSFSIFFSHHQTFIYFNVSPIVQSLKHRKMQLRELRTLSWSGCRWRSSTKSFGESIRPNSKSLPERRDEYSKSSPGRRDKLI